LVLDSFMVSVTVELGAKQEVFVVLVIVLMAFYVSDADGAWEVMESANDHVDYVPVCLECAVGEALSVRAGGRDALDEGVIVAAELDFPLGASTAEDEQVVQEASN
jgi:hypothetical protein